MPTTLTATFATRRDAEMTVERLVQEFGIERSDVFVVAAGDDNSAGDDRAGSDREAGTPSPEAREDSALNGAISVSIDLEDESRADDIRNAFDEFNAVDVAEG